MAVRTTSRATPAPAPIISTASLLEDTYTAGKVILAQDFPFYNALFVRFRIEATERIPTAGVFISNGKINMWYNPKFFAMHTGEEVCAIIIHEIDHVIFKHMYRGFGLEHDRWNVAADVAINQMIQNLPKFALLPDNLNPTLPRDLHAEEYYKKLPKEEKCDVYITGGKGGLGPHVIDDHGVWKQTDDDETSGTETIREAVRDAASKSRGNVPGNISSLIDQWLNPPSIDWKAELRNYLGCQLKAFHKTTWKRPSRRFGEEQKGRCANRMIKLMCAIDTSGSVGKEEAQEFMDEIVGIMQNYKAEVKVIECDAAVAGEIYTLTPHEIPKLRLAGGGGTDFTPVFERIQKDNIATELLVFFTDMYVGPSEFPKMEPAYKTLWVVSSKGQIQQGVLPPFGKAIQVVKEQKRSPYDVNNIPR